MNSTSNDLLERFRQLYAARSSKGASSSEAPPSYPGILPPEVNTGIQPDTSDIDKKLASITFKIPELPAEFSDIPELTALVTSTDDFPDNYWQGKNALALGALGDVATIEHGRQLIGSLTSGISQRDVGLIFLLAFQLKKPRMGVTVRALPDRDELQLLRDIGVEFLDNTVLETYGKRTEPTETGTNAEIAQGYAYLATSMLKMFTRSPENYEKSWRHITEGYKKFYSTSIPISGIKPALTVLKSIHDVFSLSDVMKTTLYRYLYNANREGTITSLQRYLYDNNLSHTGMHVVPISNRICQTMNCTTANLLRVINANRFRPQIEGLVAAFKLMKNTDDNHKRQMWKYGRIFDNNFLASLQTRACPKFVYILACILKTENPKSASGILDIKQFEEVSPEDQAKLLKGAKVLIDALKTS